MPSMLDAFTLKEYDLEPALTAWTDAPRFNGVASKGLQVDDWLDAVKAGCEARNIPRDYWPKVGQHLLDGRARKRFDELKAVLRQMHGGRYRWDWKRFKVAMRNMGWEIADDETETIKVLAKPSGSWWVLGGSKKVERDSPPAYTADPDSTHLTPGKTLSSSEKKRSTPEQKHQASEKRQPEKKQSADERPDKPKKPSRKNSVTSDIAGDDSADKLLPARPTAQRRMTSWLTRRESTTSAASEHELVEEPVVIECVPAAESSVGYFKGSSPSSATSSPAQTPGEVVTTATAHAPLWLLNASNALDFLSSEHPKTMSTIAAVLITVGSLPALPGLSAVAGGTVLASHAVQAAGAIAVGVGNWLKSAQDNAAARGQQQHDADMQAPSSNQQVVSTKGR